MNAITEVPNGALLSFIERAAKDETFDVAKFETLLRVRRDEAHDHARRVFNQAMAICQSEMLPVLRSTANKGVGGKYAKLEDIDQQMRPIYTSHGFSVRFGSAPPPQPGWLRITCTVAHESGYFEENYLDSPVSNQGAQGGRMAMTPVQAVGSVVTYLRRYLLGMVFNIVQADVVGEDDDGETMREPRAAAAAMPRAARRSAEGEDADRWEAAEAAAAAKAKATPRRTIGQLLEAVEFALKRASSRVEVDRILDAEDVLKLRANVAADSPAILRLDAMREEALERHPPMSDEDEAIDELPEIKGEANVLAG